MKKLCWRYVNTVFLLDPDPRIRNQDYWPGSGRPIKNGVGAGSYLDIFVAIEKKLPIKCYKNKIEMP
jgi:hypothetical protein